MNKKLNIFSGNQMALSILLLGFGLQGCGQPMDASTDDSQYRSNFNVLCSAEEVGVNSEFAEDESALKGKKYANLEECVCVEDSAEDVSSKLGKKYVNLSAEELEERAGKKYVNLEDFCDRMGKRYVNLVKYTSDTKGKKYVN